MITTEQIKELRDATGVSIMQCKKALEEAGGDQEKALIILKKKSSDIAAKKADREAHDGLVVVAKNTDTTAVLVLHCETDFVAKGDDFTALAKTLSEKLLADGEEKLVAEAPEIINPVVQKVGENIQLGTMKIVTGPAVGVYVHGGKSGVIVTLKGGDENLAKDVAMHIAAMKPSFIKKDDVPAETLAKATELFQEEVAKSGKPADIQEKMIQGKIDTYFKEQTLLDQSFIKNPEKTVGTLLKEHNAEIAEYVTVSATA